MASLLLLILFPTIGKPNTLSLGCLKLLTLMSQLWLLNYNNFFIGFLSFLKVFIECFLSQIFFLFVKKFGKKKKTLVGKFYFWNVTSIDFPKKLLHYSFSQNLHTKKMKSLRIWNDGMHVIAFNMCKKRNHNMNKKFNITQISNIITHSNMNPW
jgi:hypothetical protein